MLAASPLFGSFAALAWQKEEAGSGVTSPRDAIDVTDFEEAAHWGYLKSVRILVRAQRHVKPNEQPSEHL